MGEKNPLITQWRLVKKGSSTRVTGVICPVNLAERVMTDATTSPLTGQNGNTVYTRSGSTYELGNHVKGGLKKLFDMAQLKWRVPKIKAAPEPSEP